MNWQPLLQLSGGYFSSHLSRSAANGGGSSPAQKRRAGRRWGARRTRVQIGEQGCLLVISSPRQLLCWCRDVESGSSVQPHTWVPVQPGWTSGPLHNIRTFPSLSSRSSLAKSKKKRWKGSLLKTYCSRAHSSLCLVFRIHGFFKVFSGLHYPEDVKNSLEYQDWAISFLRIFQISHRRDIFII